MKETLYDLKNRRSCRKYLPEQIKDDELNAILEAGTYAPTGMGKQSPYIVVVQEPELVKKLSSGGSGNGRRSVLRSTDSPDCFCRQGATDISV